MNHPFISDLSDKSEEELQTTITNLLGKLNWASRMGNESMSRQLMMVLDSYREAYAKKIADIMEKQQAQTNINIQRYK